MCAIPLRRVTRIGARGEPVLIAITIEGDDYCNPKEEAEGGTRVTRRVTAPFLWRPVRFQFPGSDTKCGVTDPPAEPLLRFSPSRLIWISPSRRISTRNLYPFSPFTVSLSLSPILLLPLLPPFPAIGLTSTTDDPRPDKDSPRPRHNRRDRTLTFHLGNFLIQDLVVSR